VRRKDEEAIIAEARFVLVSVGRESFEPVPVPDKLRERLTPFTMNTE
jgi:acyl-CoA thioesterase FadM